MITSCMLPSNQMQTGREAVPAMGVFKTCPLRTAALQTLLSRHGLSDANSTWKAETRFRAGLKAPVLDWKYGGRSSLNSVSRLAGAIAAQLRDRRSRIIDTAPPPPPHLRPPRASAAAACLKGAIPSNGGGQSASSRMLRSREVPLKTDDDTDASTGCGRINNTQSDEPMITAPAAATAAAAATPPAHQKRQRQRAKKSALGFGLVALPPLDTSHEALPDPRCLQHSGMQPPDHHHHAGGDCGDPGTGRARLSARKRAAPCPALLSKALKSIRRPHQHQHQTMTTDDDAKEALPRSGNAADGTARTFAGIPVSRSSPASSFSTITDAAALSGSGTVALVRAQGRLLPGNRDELPPPADDDADDGGHEEGEAEHGEVAHLAALLMVAAETIKSQENEIERLCSLLEKQEKTLRLVDSELLSRICRPQEPLSASSPGQPLQQ